MSEPVVSIIVVSYNTREMTLECLRSVRAETTVPHQLIVLDNASSDGSAEAIAAEFPDILLMAETDNHGFAKGNNIAATRATGEYLLLLNPDTVVLDKAIDRLVAFAEARPEARLWGGRTVFADGSLNSGNCWQRMTVWNIFCRCSGLAALFKQSPLFNAEAYGGWDRDTEREVDIITGCFLLLKRDFWEKLGGFDLLYVMYGEEADLCLRARTEHGARPLITPEASIVHYGGASEKVRADKYVRIIRAKVTLIRQHFSGWQRLLALSIYRIWPLSRAVLISIVSPFNARLGTVAATWREIWQRRGEWWQGYKDV